MHSIWKLGGNSPLELIRKVNQRFWRHQILDQSAKLSFYFILSIFPLMIFVIHALGLVLKSKTQLRIILSQALTTLAPAGASGLIDSFLRQITRGSGGLKVSLALIFTWWSASQGMLAIINGINTAYETQDHSPWWRKYLRASGLTIAAILYIAIALLFILYGGRLSEMIIQHLGFKDFIRILWKTVEWILTFVSVLFTFNILYVFGPCIKHKKWHFLMPGTVVSVVLWILASLGFKIYLKYFNLFNVTYGPIGAVIILLLWFYLSGIAILIGAEVNAEIES